MSSPIPERGVAREAIFEALARYTAHDLPWHDGRVFGYVYLAGAEAEALGRDAFAKHLELNALDPTVFPSLLRMENEILGIAAEHLHAPEGAVGLFTSGGTESVMLAVKAARDWARRHRPEIARPKMVLPETAHACFHKAAHYLGVETVVTPADPETFEADVGAMRAAIDEETILLVGSAVAYAHGVADPIEAIGALAEEKGLLFHVDGCIGAFVLGVMEKNGETVPPFDFRVPGVTSISMDLHKYGFCPKGSSVVLFRDKAVRRHALYACSSWTGYTVINTTVQSTRSGGPIAATWAVLQYLGEAGYGELVARMRETTKKLAAGVEAIDGLRLMAAPQTTLFSFTADDFSVFVLADLMKARGWYIQPQLGYGGHRENLHVSVNPANCGWEDDFLEKLKECVAEAKKRPGVGVRPLVQKVVDTLDDGEIDGASLEQVLSLAGMGGGEVDLPEETALINEILNVLPRPLSEKLLVEYFNELFVPKRTPAFAPGEAPPRESHLGSSRRGGPANGPHTHGPHTNGHSAGRPRANGQRARRPRTNGHPRPPGGFVRRAARRLSEGLEALEKTPLGFLARRL